MGALLSAMLCVVLDTDQDKKGRTAMSNNES